MTKGLIRAGARSLLKVLAASVMVATQCLTVTPGIRGQAQNQPSVDVDLPPLVGKSMGDIIQQFKSSKKKCREVTKDLLARMPPDAPSFDDLCQFKNGRGLLNVFTYRGRAAGFMYVFGKVSTDPEEALLRVGINVNGVKPRIQEIQPGVLRYYVWSGTFSEKSWKEIKVLQLLKMNRKCRDVFAIPSDRVE